EAKSIVDRDPPNTNARIPRPAPVRRSIRADNGHRVTRFNSKDSRGDFSPSRARPRRLDRDGPARKTGDVKKMRSERDTTADRGGDDPMQYHDRLRKTAEGKQQGDVAGD